MCVWGGGSSGRYLTRVFNKSESDSGKATISQLPMKSGERSRTGIHRSTVSFDDVLHGRRRGYFFFLQQIINALGRINEPKISLKIFKAVL